MSERDRKLWMMVRRGLLLITKAIEREQEPPPLMREVRRGLLIICAAIEEECTTPELV
jgi:hypothetical protein